MATPILPSQPPSIVRTSTGLLYNVFMRKQTHQPRPLASNEALLHYEEWPVIEELGRPAGQTSEAIRQLVRDVNGTPGAGLSQQYVTPDRMTASSMIRYARERGLRPEDIASIYATVAELELFAEGSGGEVPLPLKAYPEEVVRIKLEELQSGLD